MKLFQLPLMLYAVFNFAFPQTPDGYRIEIRKAEFKLYLFKGDSLAKTFSIAVGRNPGDKQRVGDLRTPEGRFAISQIQDARTWTHDFKDGKGAIKGAYGPWFLRLRWDGDSLSRARFWKGIGIHGTHDPASIGTLATEGCIRVKSEEVEDLARMTKVGTPVQILP